MEVVEWCVSAGLPVAPLGERFYLPEIVDVGFRWGMGYRNREYMIVVSLADPADIQREGRWHFEYPADDYRQCLRDLKKLLGRHEYERSEEELTQSQLKGMLAKQMRNSPRVTCFELVDR